MCGCFCLCSLVRPRVSLSSCHIHFSSYVGTTCQLSSSRNKFRTVAGVTSLTHHSRPLCCCWPPTLSWFHARLVRTAMATYPVKTCDEPMNEVAPDARVPSLVTEKLTDQGSTWMHGDTLHYHTNAHRRKTQKLQKERRSTTVAERATVAVGVERVKRPCGSG